MRNLAMVLAILTIAACDVLGPKTINDQFVCMSNDAGMGSFKLELDEEQAAEWGAAFDATGNCDATIKKSIFTSPGLALRAGGNTKLVFEEGRIEGNPAIEASGNAVIELKGTVVVGEVKTSGNAKVIGLEEAK